jgi:casein kinase II subunit beta
MDKRKEEDHESSINSSTDLSGSEEDTSWIEWFVNLRGNEFFCAVSEDFIQDDFNLCSLSNMVPYYDYALDMILDVEAPFEEELNEEQQEIVETASEVLYGLIHSRYILTSKGMQAMHDKFTTAHFGRCPRVYCQGQPVLPVGLSDIPRNYSVNVYCPKCHDIFYPRSTRQASLDGAYFGSTFAHLFLLLFPEVIPSEKPQLYTPRIYGFKIHTSSVYYSSQTSSGNKALTPTANSSSKQKKKKAKK